MSRPWPLHHTRAPYLRATQRQPLQQPHLEGAYALVTTATEESDGTITAIEYGMITSGLERDEVAAIVGGFGDVERTSDSVLTVHYRGDGFPDVYVRFENGAVIGVTKRVDNE